MLGVPYDGRVPDFRNQAPSEPVSPSVLHQRALREEQDQAYQESLLVQLSGLLRLLCMTTCKIAQP